MARNVEEITMNKAQLEDFKSQSQFFSCAVHMVAIYTTTPAPRLDFKGDKHPRQ